MSRPSCAKSSLQKKDRRTTWFPSSSAPVKNTKGSSHMLWRLPCARWRYKYHFWLLNLLLLSSSTSAVIQIIQTFGSSAYGFLSFFPLTQITSPWVAWSDWGWSPKCTSTSVYASWAAFSASMDVLKEEKNKMMRERGTEYSMIVYMCCALDGYLQKLACEWSCLWRLERIGAGDMDWGIML